MTIIEQTVRGKRSQETCEDAIVVTDNYVAVIDGSTSKSVTRFHPDMSNGQYCATLVSQYIRSMPADLTAGRFAMLVTAFLRFVYQEQQADMQLLTDIPTERMAASAAIYSRHRREVWLVGDCQCLVDGCHHDNPKPYEAALADIRSGFLRLQLLQGTTQADIQRHDTGRDLIVPMLIESCKAQNKTFTVIDGFPMPVAGIKVVPATNAREIVLASDGYPTLLPTLAESEQALAALLADDPLCIGNFRATKGLMQGNASFDDRAYVRFQPTM